MHYYSHLRCLMHYYAHLRYLMHYYAHLRYVMHHYAYLRYLCTITLTCGFMRLKRKSIRTCVVKLFDSIRLYNIADHAGSKSCNI